MTNRREFLQTIAAITGVSLLPTNRLTTTAPTFFFIHTNSEDSFQIANPVQWCLDHAQKPILDRASDGLRNLSTGDSERIIRLVVRRCGLNLVEVQSNQVTIHHWLQHPADLKPFFKANELTRSEVQVTLLNRKKETATQKTGDDFLYGQPTAADFPVELFTSKWQNRYVNESDDGQASPTSNSGLAWDGLEDGQIPWAALKSAWRQGGVVCQNCAVPTFLVNFGLRQVGMFHRASCFERVCGACQRSFVGDLVKDVSGWMAANLDAEVRPGFKLIWGNRVKWMAKA